jgi:hypothetical protein
MPSRRKSSACTDYVPAICTHRPSLLPIGCGIELDGDAGFCFRTDSCVEFQQYFSARGSKSRNKVAVGEPAAGSLPKSACSLRRVHYDKTMLEEGRLSQSTAMHLVPALTVCDQVTTIALNGGCLGSGIDEDRS